jgi:asparagine synthase (glutamine-hydrolysing)
MNRIAGIYNFQGNPIDSTVIVRMLNSMEYHRYSEWMTWTHDGIGLGRTCSGSRSEESEAGLLSDRSYGRYYILLDGRLDNRQELLQTLKSQLLRDVSSISDEDLIVLALQKWGLDFPGHLIGDFAFVVWDNLERCLICVRDHFGVKPFYYAHSQGNFIFASTPLAILESGKHPQKIHEERIADFLVNSLEGIDKTSSFYTDVFRLPPAHMLIVQSSGSRVERYWEIQSRIEAGSITEADYLELFKNLFTQSVQSKLQDLSAPASMLSGGLDSSAVVGMSCRLLIEEKKQPLDVFAALSNLHDTNRESAYVSSLLCHLGLTSHLIAESTICNWMDELVTSIELEAEPFDYLMNLNRSVYLNAKTLGFSAMLDGVDGDILLSSSGHLMQLWRQLALPTIYGETLGAEGLTAEYKKGRKLFFTSLFSSLSFLVPDKILNIRRQKYLRNYAELAVSESIIDKGFASQILLCERIKQLESHNPRSSSTSQREFHRIVLEHPSFTVGLERYERVASGFGIEARHPFTDVRLAEFCLDLPWQLKTRNGWSKYILRKAMEPYLPAEVIWRRDKDSLMWEYNRLILKNKAEYFHQATLDERDSLKPYVDVQKLERIWQEYLTQGDEKNAMLIWSGIALAFWLRRHRNMVRDLKLGQ